ncbi:MAG: DUF1682 domain-containing protein [Cyanobacteria bacterium CRU_2_1]|nr:DUF1682 domain-containing protein [Cyanobacteria bacterium RU_5_0]NJR59889.1 DUF1682 domain-containing protein [Cyanobacteria bacterium CRU_2_1]
MGDSLEDLLAQMKAKYGGADNADAPPKPSAANNPPRPQPQSPQVKPSQPSGSIDDLLADVQGRPAPQTPQPSKSQFPPISTPSDHPRQSTPSLGTFADQGLIKSDVGQAATDNLLSQLKSQYEDIDRAEELKQQEQLRAEERKHQEQIRQEQRRQEELKRQRRAALEKHAEEWLKKLDPRSGEAAWFEEFATKYPSRLEAAIDYLGVSEEPSHT